MTSDDSFNRAGTAAKISKLKWISVMFAVVIVCLTLGSSQNSDTVLQAEEESQLALIKEDNGLDIERYRKRQMHQELQRKQNIIDAQANKLDEGDQLIIDLRASLTAYENESNEVIAVLETELAEALDGNKCGISPNAIDVLAQAQADTLVAVVHESSGLEWNFGRYGDDNQTCSSYSSEMTSSGKLICLNPTCPQPDEQEFWLLTHGITPLDRYVKCRTSNTATQSAKVSCGSSDFNILVVQQLQGGAFVSRCWTKQQVNAILVGQNWSTLPSSNVSWTYSASATHLDIDCTENGCLIEDGIEI